MQLAFTCWSILQKLFELSWRELCARDGHGHSDLCELDLNVGLLQITEEGGGGNSLGGAIRRTLHNINDHLGPERQFICHDFLLDVLQLMTGISTVRHQRNLLVVGQGLHTIDVHSESLVASQDLMKGLHQLLLLGSNICFLFIKNQDHKTILILTQWNTAKAHCLKNMRQTFYIHYKIN